MEQKLIISICIISFVSAQSSSPEWEKYKLDYLKKYQEQEEAQRKAIFLENVKQIAEHNELYDKGVVSFKLQLNSFGDLTSEEFLQFITGLNIISKRKEQNMEEENVDQQTLGASASGSETLPSSIDWRQRGAVTEVKNQGSCGSCVAFATIGSLESHYFLKTGTLVQLSEQNIIDCSMPPGGGSKCQGRKPYDEMEFIQSNGGIETEKDYPYQAEGGTCKNNPSMLIAPIQSYEKIPTGDEQKLQEALANVGPVSIPFHATTKFQFYSSGVFYEPNCDPSSINHAMTAVGYGTDENGTEYYIVKNSWGKRWGANGYVYLARNRGNNCGLATAAFYPVL